MKLTYRDLYSLTSREIDRRIRHLPTAAYNSQLSRTNVAPMTSNALSDVSTAELITALQTLLSDVVEPRIITGLEVVAADPITDAVTISAGTGTAGGKLYTLEEDATIAIPFDSSTSVFYICLYLDKILIEKEEDSHKLVIAKIIVPEPGVTRFIQDDKDDSWNAYIVSYRTFSLYGNSFNKFEENTLELLRDNIGAILADNIIGNIRLNEDLKITNVAGTLEINSNSLSFNDINGNELAKFDTQGIHFFDSASRELARFTTDDAFIGNISITKNSIESRNYISENRGFRITDSGFAEFGDVRVRGRLSSSVFEYDKISAVGGKLIVGNASVLSIDLSPSATTITVDDSVFSTGDILLIKEGVNEEYLEILDDSNAPTYTVTRDISSGYTTNPTWYKGTAIVSTGNSNSGEINGFIVLDSVSTYSPFIDINLRNSDIYNDWSTKVRLGNLSGISDSCFGGGLSGFGLYSDNVYLKGILSASTICGSEICTSTLTAATMQTSATNPRTVFDAYGIKSFDASGNQNFEVQNGNVWAKNLTLYNPDCCCDYSYLSAGEWYFHDRLGNINPYAKRICSGEATTGSTVVLEGWSSAPKIQVGVKELLSFNPDYSVNCQKWCIYYDNLTPYTESDGTYGYCFDVHAQLLVSAGAFDECIQDVAEDTTIHTHANTCKTTIKNKFQLWCYCNTSSLCYGYGVLCYNIKYRIDGASTWCDCAVCFEQPHVSLAELKQDTCQCTTLTFDSNEIWEVQVDTVTLTWCLSTLSGVSTCCCCRTFTGTASQTSVYCLSGYTGSPINVADSDSNTVSLSGSNPTSDVYCTYLCYTWNSFSPHLAYCASCLINHSGYYYSSIVIGGTSAICCRCDYYESAGNTSWGTTSGCSNLDSLNSTTLSNLCLNNYSYISINPSFGTSMWGCNYTNVCLVNGYLIQCYCTLASNTSCSVFRLYSNKDYSGADTVLDPSGIVSYVAIGYS